MGVHTFPAIIVNYIVAMGCGIQMLSDDYHIVDQFEVKWFSGGLLMGFLFIGLFYLMAYTAQRLGMAVSSVATKMSLVIPVAFFMITKANDEPTFLKISAVCLAVLGVLLTSQKGKQGKDVAWYVFLFPVIIFLGSGAIDLLIGHYSDFVETENDKFLFTSTPFFTSAMIGLVVSIIQVFIGKFKFNWQTLVGGAILGIVNFGSIYYLVKAYDSGFLPSSSVVSLNNLGVILFSSIVGVALFKEQLNLRKSIGIAVAVIAIVMLLI
ncbi:MAG: EamA/RhaT family transporter [Bacteroidota bacterium]